MKLTENIWSLGGSSIATNLSHVFQSLRVGQQLPDEPPGLFGRVVQGGGWLAPEQVHWGQEVVRTLATLKMFIKLL